MEELTPEVIQSALDAGKRLGCREVEVKAGDVTFKAGLPAEDEPVDVIEEAAGEEPAETPAASPVEKNVEAPVVGHFQPLEDEVEVGNQVEKGQVIAEITALGLANDVVAPAGGEIVEILVAAGDAVEYGQALAVIRLES
jgi:acetyl-CoA carboxylase biotin carboxyl carrier protein